MTGKRKRKVGPIMLALYRLSDAIDRMSRVNYAAWCAVGAGAFGLIICIFIQVIPPIPTVSISFTAGWIMGWVGEGNRR